MKTLIKSSALILVLALAACSDVKETSGYNACMRTVTQDVTMQKQCITDGITAAGYDSWLDCAARGMDDPLCGANDNARYKAEVRVYNSCLAESQARTMLNEADCNVMLQK